MNCIDQPGLAVTPAPTSLEPDMSDTPKNSWQAHIDHVRAKRPPAALAALTSLIEEIYFSGRVSDEGVLAIVETRAAASIAERTAAIAV